MKKINELMEIFKEIFEGEYCIQLGDVQYVIENTFTFTEKKDFFDIEYNAEIIEKNKNDLLVESAKFLNISFDTDIIYDEYFRNNKLEEKLNIFCKKYNYNGFDFYDLYTIEFYF